MNGYTSGYRAEIGLPPANHDPLPYVYYDGLRLSQPLIRTIGMADYAPRPEFNVPDNPILVAFRRSHEGGGSRSWPDLRTWNKSIVTDNGGFWSCHYKPAHIEHARRVLEKLSNVYRED